VSDGGQLKSFFDNLMRKQAREAGADRTMDFLDSFGQPSVGQDRITPQAFAMLNPEQQNQVLRRLREEGVDLGPYMAAAGVEGTDVVDAANIAFNLPFDALSAVANLTNLERGREEGFGANVEGARGAFSESLDPDRFAPADYAREIGAPFPETTGFLLDVLAPGPGELRMLDAWLPPALLRALGKITGVTDDAGMAVPIAHGTPILFDEPRASRFGSEGPGFYVAAKEVDEDPNPQPYKNWFNTYAEFGGRSATTTPMLDPEGRTIRQGARVIPGFYGTRADETLVLGSNERMTPEQYDVLRKLYANDPDFIESLNESQRNQSLNQESFWRHLTNAQDDFYNKAEDFEQTLSDLGISAMYDPGDKFGTIQNPAQNFLPAYDAPRIRQFIDQNRDALTDEEYRAAMEVLDSVRDPNAPVSASGRQPLPADYLERVRGWIGRTATPRGRFYQLSNEPMSAEIYAESMNLLPENMRKFVTVLSPEEIQQGMKDGNRYYMTDQGAGFAIGADGEFMGVFNAGPERGMAPEMVRQSIEEGATHLFAFDADKSASVVNLPELYGSVIHNGKQYQITERMPWNDEYAPENWNYDLYGRPEYVRMDLVEVGE